MSSGNQDSRLIQIAPLGRGGTAEVTRVLATHLKREVACKSPFEDTANAVSEFRPLARREYELVGGHRFPGLVRLIEPPHSDPEYLLLEICEGPTLDAVGRIDDLSTALRVLSAVAVSLEYLRARSLVHGDLKPQNIFVPKDWRGIPQDRLWYAKISDFSLGRRMSEPEAARLGVGTVGYMAPEVISEKCTSHQSDLFAFGVIAYSALTGVHPFLTEDCEPVKVNSRIQEEAVVPVEKLRPELEGHPVLKVVDALLAKKSVDRPKTAWEVCQLLEKAGSTYPYRRAIRPRYLWTGGESYQDIVATVTISGESETRQLETFTGGDAAHLSVLIGGNWAIRNLQYVGGTFAFAEGVQWPLFMRNQQLNRFARLTLREKKRRIWQAGTLDLGAVPPPDKPQLALLTQLLNTKTVVRLSRSAAVSVERAEQFERANDLWLRAGDLPGAERCALQGATALTKQDRRREALQLTNRVIGFARMTLRLQEVSELLLLSGTLLKDSGDTSGAESIYKELIADLSAKPVSKTLGIVYNKLGDLYKMRSDFDAGREALEKALSIFERLDDQLEYSHTCNNLGNIYWVIGDLSKSGQYLRRALRVQRKLNAREDIASTLSNLGSIVCISGRIPRGLFLMQKSLEIKREIGNAGEIARTLNNLGYVSYITGDNAKAVEYLSESLEMNRRVGSRKEILINIENLTAIMISAGQMAKSLALVREGLTLSREIGDTVQEILLQVSLATALVRLGKLGEARALLDELAGKSGTADDPAIGVVYRCATAEFDIVVGRFDLAAQQVREALAVTGVDPFVKLRAVLLAARLEGNDDLTHEVDELAAQTQFERLRVVYRVNCGERILRESDYTAALRTIIGDLDAVVRMEDDLEAPRLCLTAAEALLANGRGVEARRFVDRAQTLAKRFGTAPDLFAGAIVSGRLWFEAGDYEQAIREYRQAIAAAKAMASTLTKKQDQIDFQSKHEVTFLLGEIERLGLILGQKKRAGAKPARA